MMILIGSGSTQFYRLEASKGFEAFGNSCLSGNSDNSRREEASGSEPSNWEIMILGVDWMKKHTPVTFDFNDNTLTIFRKGQQLVLKGLTE